MPRAKRRCAKPTCKQFQPCPIHPPGWRKHDRRYERLPDSTRRAVRAGASGQCQWVENGIRCGNAGTEVDHIINQAEWPEGKPGVHDIGNLQLLCEAHHRRKTAEERARAIKRKWGKL